MKRALPLNMINGERAKFEIQVMDSDHYLTEIFLFIPVGNIFDIRLVCQKWKSVIDELMFQKRLTVFHFPSFKILSQTTTFDWKLWMKQRFCWFRSKVLEVKRLSSEHLKNPNSKPLLEAYKTSLNKCAIRIDQGLAKYKMNLGIKDIPNDLLPLWQFLNESITIFEKFENKNDQESISKVNISIVSPKGEVKFLIFKYEEGICFSDECMLKITFNSKVKKEKKRRFTLIDCQNYYSKEYFNISSIIEFQKFVGFPPELIPTKLFTRAFVSLPFLNKCYLACFLESYPEIKPSTSH